MVLKICFTTCYNIWTIKSSLYCLKWDEIVVIWVLQDKQYTLYLKSEITCTYFLTSNMYIIIILPLLGKKVGSFKCTLSVLWLNQDGIMHFLFICI